MILNIKKILQKSAKVPDAPRSGGKTWSRLPLHKQRLEAAP
jgi:hypothetical protein